MTYMNQIKPKGRFLPDGTIANIIGVAMPALVLATGYMVEIVTNAAKGVNPFAGVQYVSQFAYIGVMVALIVGIFAIYSRLDISEWTIRFNRDVLRLIAFVAGFAAVLFGFGSLMDGQFLGTAIASAIMMSPFFIFRAIYG